MRRISHSGSIQGLLTVHSVWLNSLLLQAGLGFSDLPGNNDSNVHRVRFVERFSKKCRATLMVDEIKRTGDNVDLKENIWEVWRRRQGDSVNVVLTRSDVSTKIYRLEGYG
jgi:hypothetical protein